MQSIAVMTNLTGARAFFALADGAKNGGRLDMDDELV